MNFVHNFLRLAASFNEPEEQTFVGLEPLESRILLSAEPTGFANNGTANQTAAMFNPAEYTVSKNIDWKNESEGQNTAHPGGVNICLGDGSVR